MTTLADRFEEQIQQHELPPPIPRWRITAKCIGIWSLFALMLLLGASSVAIAVWFATDPFSLAAELRESQAMYSLVTGLPLVWIFAGCFAVCSAAWFFVQTPHGYRYRMTLIAAAVFVSVVCVGVALMAAGLAESLERAASYVPGYARVISPPTARFMRPDSGMLFGRIESMATGTWEIRDAEDGFWTVMMGTTTEFPPHAQGQRQMVIGGCVRISGEASSTTRVLQADSIRPCPRGLHMRPVR